MNNTLKGGIAGIVSAVSYGMNPLGALYLYQEGINAPTVLFYRFALAAAMLAGLTWAQGNRFAVTGRQAAILMVLGILFGLSALSLYESFHYMSAGISCSLLFVYPVMVAVIMASFFHERLTKATLLSILLALSGIALLYKGEGDATLDTWGVSLVMVSALAYALYIVIVNRAALNMPIVKMTFYVVVACAATIGIGSLGDASTQLQWLSTPRTWGFAFLLALFPSIISLVTMTIAVRHIGSTPTAIMGALEPIVAVAIGCYLFQEPFSWRDASGILLILIAVILIILSKAITLRRVARLLRRWGIRRHKIWLWKP